MLAVVLRRLAPLVLAAVAVSACGASEAEEPDALVTVTAEWQCDRQRFAFESLAAMDELRSELLASAGVSDAEFAAFEAQMADDAALRASVGEAYDAICG